MKRHLTVMIISFLFVAIFTIFMPQLKAVDATLTQLTTNPYMDVWPSWHPSGSKIVYCAFSNDQDRSIWVLDFFNSSNKVALTNGYIDECPSFSSDGQKITFARWGLRGDYHDLMIMNSDGSNITRITFGGIPGLAEGCYESPQFSNDDQEILFEYWPYTSPGGPDNYVGIMNIDGMNVRVIGNGSYPHWCPDNSKIVYQYPNDWCGQFQNSNTSIYIMNRDGTNVVKLTDGQSDHEPHMSSTGRIVFSRNSDLFTMNVDSSGISKLIDDGRQPHWSPDGKWIVFWSQQRSGNRDIWALGPTTSPVGGIYIPVNKLELLAPYIGLTILLTVAIVAVVYVKKRKRNTEIIS